MERKRYALCSGNIYKKIKESKYTYVWCCTVERFLDYAMEDENVRSSILSVLNSVTQLLQRASCRLIKQLVIDYNFIEVQPYGTCFNIMKKCFEKDPKMNGSPRCFIRYEYRKEFVPYPRPFVQGTLFTYLNHFKEHRFSLFSVTQICCHLFFIIYSYQNL